MKKIMSIALLVFVVVAVVGMNVNWSGEPDYVQSAEMRVTSYLTSDYEHITCNSKKINDQRWELVCISSSKGKTFQFAVFSSDNAPYGVSRPFYLEAINDEAKESAEQGLMSYLQINTKAS
ncbi:hypothetical protein [Enterobacter bugandensis]|uniref:hypothetical protein n=1 Tax=Enterobacter bugandensis TaxID=881260 RepID=UPI000667DF53|nr:hypothetical protein [Enterobacter bugandensis]